MFRLVSFRHTSKRFVKSEVLTVTSMKTAVFWVLAPDTQRCLQRWLLYKVDEYAARGVRKTLKLCTLWRSASECERRFPCFWSLFCWLGIELASGSSRRDARRVPLQCSWRPVHLFAWLKISIGVQITICRKPNTTRNIAFLTSPN
jgi:hypothetical protein